MAITPPSHTVTAIKETVKENLVGSEEEKPQPSASTKAIFFKHARKDEASGELIMGEKEFVNAIAPVNEDYVSSAVSVARRI